MVKGTGRGMCSAWSTVLDTLFRARHAQGEGKVLPYEMLQIAEHGVERRRASLGGRALWVRWAMTNRHPHSARSRQQYRCYGDPCRRRALRHCRRSSSMTAASS